MIEAQQLLIWGSGILVAVLTLFGRLTVWVIRRELTKLDHLVEENAEIKDRLSAVESAVGIAPRVALRRGGVKA